MMWLRGMLKELQLLRNETVLHCDNVVIINIANNPVQFDRTKHVEIDRFSRRIFFIHLEVEY
jgi:hypothetical protein